MRFKYVCSDCGKEYITDEIMYQCPECSKLNDGISCRKGNLVVTLDTPSYSADTVSTAFKQYTPE